MNRHQMLKKIDTITNMPTLPAIAMQVNRLLQDYDSPLERLVGLLEKDQSLVLRILRLVNSSFFGFQSKVNSVRHAVALLGYNTVRNAVVTVAVIDTLALKKNLNGFEITAFWEHSTQVAVTSRFLAVHTRLAAVEDAFTAGLLHDIGKIVLANYFPDELSRILEAQKTDDLTFLQAEQQLDSCPHALIGSLLAGRWMLPETLVDAIGHHHGGDSRSGSARLSILVRVADSFTHIMNGRANGFPPLEQVPTDIKEVLTKTIKQAQEWYPQLKQDILAACSFLKKE
jgi:putative nucleotidyltransferase with HDIG domain